MSDTTKMRIEFEVGTGGADEGIRVLNTNVDELVNRIKNVSPSVENTGRSFEGFTDKLRHFKTEQTSNARTARFFATELASIIPGAEGAAKSLQKLVGVGLEGFGIAAAFEATLFVLDQVAEHFREQEKEAQALRQIHRDTWNSAAEALEEYQHGLSKTGTQSDEVWRGITKRVADEVGKIQNEIDDYSQSNAAKFRDFAKGALLMLPGIGPLISEHFDSAADKVDKFAEKQKAAQEVLKDPDLQEKKRLAAAAESSKMHSAFLREEETLSVAADDEIVRIRIERDHKLETLRRVDFASEEDYSGRRTTIEAEAAEKIRRIREDRDARDAARRRTMAAENGSAIEKLDADHENRIEQLREGLRRTSLAGEQQRIRQEIEDESEAHSKKRDLLQREIDDRLRAGALAVDRKKYEEQLGYLKTQADLDDEIRAREEAGSNEQLAQEFLRIQQAHDRERAELEVLHGEKLISEAKYQDQVRQLEERTRLDRLKAAGEASSAGAFVNPLMQNWQSGLTQMLQGTYQWSNLTKNILASLVGSFAQGAAQMATEWLGQEALRFAGWAAIKVKELALHTATEATKTSTTLSGTAARIPAEAGEAAVLAGASAAAVPGIGWLIALPAAGAVLGGLLAYGLSSASGGYDIGSENPLTQLHAREMVLPASIAEPLRQSLSGGGGFGGGDVSLHLNLPDVYDATGFDRVLEKHQGSLVRLLRELKANNRIR